MDVNIEFAHWVYLLGLVVILVTMGFKKNPILPSVLFTGLVALVWTGSLVNGITAMFTGTLVAATDLFSIVLIIALITSMLVTLRTMGADTLMVKPVARLMHTGPVAFLVLGIGTYALSLFFWPTPAVPLIAAVLIPGAIAAGLRPMTTAMVIAIAGQGMALSSDYIIRVAPELSATASGGDAGEIASKALVLSLTTGLVALVITFVMERRHMIRFASVQERELAVANFAGQGQVEGDSALSSTGRGGSGLGMELGDHAATDSESPTSAARFMAILTPLSFGLLVAYMIISKASSSVDDLEGGQAAAMVGGTAFVLTFIAALMQGRATRSLGIVADSVQEGFGFAIKIMSIVFPIAGFFFLGNPAFSAQIMGVGDDAEAPGFLFDLVKAAQPYVPDSPVFLIIGVLLAGMVGGLDGAGFSVLPLTGSLAGAFGGANGVDVETLAAVGQMGAIWVGGGVLAAWSSVVAVAAFSKVDPVLLTRRCVVPVFSGLAAAVVIAALFF